MIPKLESSADDGQAVTSKDNAFSEVNKSIVQSHQDLTKDDEAAYYEKEGKEIFGSTECAKEYEQKLLMLLF